ncbi:MAG: ferredoxin [Rhizonema sp. PD38]|nr:ferredoxin [Rhizonema sp. PD38]
MKVVVDLNLCQGYGQCCYEAPDSFKLKGAEILVYDYAPDKRLRGDIERAALSCRVRAISVEQVHLFKKQYEKQCSSSWLDSESKTGIYSIQRSRSCNACCIHT